jgi:hypothetical protein
MTTNSSINRTFRWLQTTDGMDQLRAHQINNEKQLHPFVGKLIAWIVQPLNIHY